MISKTGRQDMTHSELVVLAGKWLVRQSCAVVVTEVTAGCSEQPDALGWYANGHSILVECKVSRSDFAADSRKYFRTQLDRGLGVQRYYMCPTNMIAESELPAGWGLLYVNDRLKVHKVKDADYQKDYNYQGATGMLVSLIRRTADANRPGVSVKVYTYQTKNRAAIYAEIEDTVNTCACGAMYPLGQPACPRCKANDELETKAREGV